MSTLHLKTQWTKRCPRIWKQTKRVSLLTPPPKCPKREMDISNILNDQQGRTKACWPYMELEEARTTLWAFYAKIFDRFPRILDICFVSNFHFHNDRSLSSNTTIFLQNHDEAHLFLPRGWMSPELKICCYVFTLSLSQWPEVVFRENWLAPCVNLTQTSSSTDLCGRD